MPRFKVEALRHMNTVYLVEADNAEAAGNIVQRDLDDEVNPADHNAVVSVLRDDETDAEVIGVYGEHGAAQPSGPPC